MKSSILFFVSLCLLLCGTTSSPTAVTSLPGYDGALPFKLETGYIGVGETEDVQLFYYFVESQRTPSADPLVLWLAGGPGCSAILPLFYESGPLAFTITGYNGSLPTLQVNPYSWTKALNIIYLDAPVGTGFSYSTTQEGYVSNDVKSVVLTYEFLRKWMANHTQFKSNQLYIGGDSYSGVTVPLVVQEILDGNMVDGYPRLNLKGYVLGNPKTDTNLDDNWRISFANRLGLIPDELYQTAYNACSGNFVNVDTSNAGCEAALQTIEELVRMINIQGILEPECSVGSPQRMSPDRRSLHENATNLLLSKSKAGAYWCRNYVHVLSGIWANDITVRAALHVREKTKDLWTMCNGSLAYTQEFSSVIDYHRNFSNKAILRALIYSGDHDMSVPHLSTRDWIRSLGMTLMDSWRAWFLNAQVAGYTEEYQKNNYVLTFATVKGGGHIAAEYKQEQCSAMMDRWLAYYPL